jgi:LysR family transcriptional regulator, transcriptional activator for dmlA
MGRNLTSGAGVQPADLSFVNALAEAGTLSAAARELGVSTAAVSKRLAQIEARLGLSLIHRTTRRAALTPEGELYVQAARRILSEIDDLSAQLRATRSEPSGQLRINATLGFGRTQIGPMISRFMRRYPMIQTQLQLSVDPPALTDESWDVCVRFGAPPDSRLISRRLAANRRVLCAAPGYLTRHGTPKAPADLSRHACITIRQGGDAYGVWRFAPVRAREPDWQSVKVRGNLSTNDGEIAVNWALDGHGILMRAQWDLVEHLKSGRLVQVLDAYRTPDADVYVVYPQRHQTTARVRAWVDFLAAEFAR